MVNSQPSAGVPRQPFRTPLRPRRSGSPGISLRRDSASCNRLHPSPGSRHRYRPFASRPKPGSWPRTAPSCPPRFPRRRRHAWQAGVRSPGDPGRRARHALRGYPHPRRWRRTGQPTVVSTG